MMHCVVGHGGPPWLCLPTIAPRPAGCAAAEADSAQARHLGQIWPQETYGEGGVRAQEPVTRDGEGRADGAVSMKLNRIFRFLNPTLYHYDI